MATRDTPFDPGTPCWIDLLTSDLERAKTFYGSVLGWEFDDSGPEFGGYLTARSDGHRVAGLMHNDGQAGKSDQWNTYLATSDIEASIAGATARGATVLMPVMAVADQGSMAMLVDPTGAAVGLWQAAEHTGFTKYNEPGSVVWDELRTTDFAAAEAFYAAVFGWTYDVTSDTEDFRYLTAKVGDHQVAGLMDAAAFLPPEVPSYWAVYFNVADADDALARGVAAGATVQMAPEDSSIGRLARLSDPTGAGFDLHATKLAHPTADDQVDSEV
jgi:predicted enzyme related to lactoylglutathione lyase